MDRLFKAVLLCAAASYFFCTAAVAQDIKWESISREIKGGICVFEDPSAPQVIYLGTMKGLYKTEDAGLSWKPVLHERNMAVNHIAIDADDSRRVFAATSKGIYASCDAGQSWKNVFRSLDAYEANCRAIIARLPVLYAGTDRGLMVSIDAGSHWKKESGQIGSSRIMAIAADAMNDGFLYTAAADGLYRKKISGGQWEKMLDGRLRDTDVNDSEEAPDNDDSPYSSSIRFLCADPAQPGTVYCATSSGVLASNDSAETWNNLTGSGLTSGPINVVSSGSESRLYAAARADVFQYQAEQWHRVGSGITGRAIRGLAFGSGRVYAAGDAGLFACAHKKTGIFSAQKPHDRHTRGLPPIASVQAAAIAYADVDINKIHQWRRRARNKAFLPDIDVGLNKDTSDLWHWEGGSTTKEYDDILRKGKEVYEWDVNLRWDFGELIWNDAQTSIDTRSRLLVQLRGDILDEVTKLYFEYVRVRMEMDSLTLMDKKKLAEKEVRLKELAAQLDGLTGNFFTRN